jgi:hypothetical protein
MTSVPEYPNRTAARRQKELTERLCVMPVRRSKGTNFKWSTWKWRLGMRGEATQ